MTDRAKDILTRADQLATERAGFEGHWQEIIDYIRPDAPSPLRRGGMPGGKTRQKIVDSTGEMAAELLASSLHGSLNNPATEWFTLRSEEEALNRREDVAVSLESGARDMLTVFNSPTSGFTPACHETYLDMVNFGPGHMFTADRRTTRGYPVRFQTRPVAEIFIAENGEDRVDTWFRRFEMKAHQAAAMPGWRVGAKIREAAADPAQCDKVFRFVHAIEPRRDMRAGVEGRGNLPYTSDIVCLDDQTLVYRGGFEEAPFVTGRWSKSAGETYGRGPGMKALPDVKMLQRIGSATIRGAETTIHPTLMVPDDGVLSPVTLQSGGMVNVRSELLTGPGNPIRPIITDARVDIGWNFQQRVQARVEMAFYSHLIQINQDPRMTATQVLEISERVMQALGPMLGRLQTEFLGPLIDRVFAVMWRAGRFNFPPELAGAPLKIEYVSPIARAQRLNEAQGILRSLAAGEQIAGATGDVTIFDNYDLDGTLRDLHELYGAPRKRLRAPDQVEAMRQARREVADRQAQQAEALQTVQTLAAGAKGAAALAGANTVRAA